MLQIIAQKLQERRCVVYTPNHIFTHPSAHTHIHVHSRAHTRAKTYKEMYMDIYLFIPFWFIHLLVYGFVLWEILSKVWHVVRQKSFKNKKKQDKMKQYTGNIYT